MEFVELLNFSDASEGLSLVRVCRSRSANLVNERFSSKNMHKCVFLANSSLAVVSIQVRVNNVQYEYSLCIYIHERAQ